MTGVSERLDAIEARSNDPFSTAASDMAQMDEDRDYLLDLARKQQAAIDAVREACDRPAHPQRFGGQVKLAKYWYYGTLFLVFSFLFDIALHFSDNWETCQKLFAKGEYYLLKAEEHRP